MTVPEYSDDSDRGARISALRIGLSVPKLTEGNSYKTAKKIRAGLFLEVSEPTLALLTFDSEFRYRDSSCGRFIHHFYIRSLYQHGPPTA